MIARCRRRGLVAVAVLVMVVACSPNGGSNGPTDSSGPTSPASPFATSGAQACSLDVAPGAGEGTFPSEISLPEVSRDGVAHQVRPGQSVDVHVEIRSTTAQPIQATLCVTLSCSALDPAEHHRVGLAMFEVPGNANPDSPDLADMDLSANISPKCEPLEDNDSADGSLRVIVRDSTGRVGVQEFPLAFPA